MHRAVAKWKPLAWETGTTRRAKGGLRQVKATARLLAMGGGATYRRSSASRASNTVRTRARWDGRSTGRIRATCPQSYSPQEVAPSRAMVRGRAAKQASECSSQGNQLPTCTHCTLLRSDGSHPGKCQTRSRRSHTAQPMPCILLWWVPTRPQQRWSRSGGARRVGEMVAIACRQNHTHDGTTRGGARNARRRPTRRSRRSCAESRRTDQCLRAGPAPDPCSAGSCPPPTGPCRAMTSRCRHSPPP